jgi:hypothetical protein
MIGIEEDSVTQSTITVFDTEKGKEQMAWIEPGVAKGLVCDEKGSQLAFLFTRILQRLKTTVFITGRSRERLRY